MNLYMKNQEINNLYKKFVADEDHSVFSVDESFLDVTALSYFHCETAYKMARIIQRVVYNHVGIYVTVGIGDNPLLAKLALDNGAKHSPDFIAEWRYDRVPDTSGSCLLDRFCGIGRRMAKRLNRLGIDSVYELAQANPHLYKKHLA